MFLKLGASGIIFSSPTRVFHVPAEKLTPVSVNGAGDTFVGAIIAQLHRYYGIKGGIVSDELMEQFVRFGVKCAGLTLLSKGISDKLHLIRRKEVA